MSSTKISSEQLKHIANLARLEIKADKQDLLIKQLSQTAEYIDILSQVDTKNVTPTYQVNHLKNVCRQDKVGQSLSQSEALSQAPKTHNGYFQTQATIKK
jgi:aspartyl-tRNA(Asn)/glutamyl-tRNA(Gln) amidotransferase subunit C